MRAYCWGFVAAAIVLTAALGLPAQKPAPAPIDKDKVMRRFAEEFVLLTPGKGKFPASFRMGSTGDAPDTEKPAVTVTFAAPFAVARYEVTQELYEAVMGTNPSRWKGPRNSVEMVSWEEANEFCRKATAELRRLKLLTEGEVIRLPSEAEWEYACRAGTDTDYSFGTDARKLGDCAWFADNSSKKTHPVGQKKPNPWGLYDMHGNVAEWCQDVYGKGYYQVSPEKNPHGPADGKEYVLRGGSWKSPAVALRSSYRLGDNPGFSDACLARDAIGFRCVRKAPPEGATQ
jgi:formylglycine-generating enzyme required for sulfatase activity